MACEYRAAVASLYERYGYDSKYAAKIKLAADHDRIGLIYQYVKTNTINKTTFYKMIEDFVK